MKAPGFRKLTKHWKNLALSEEQAQAEKDARDRVRNRPKKSYRIRHTGGVGVQNQTVIHLVPLLSKPLFVHHKPQAGKDECPTCGVIHPVKTIHLWLDQNGSCLVSEGVLRDLERASPGQEVGLAKHDLELVGGVDNPPPLKLDGRATRRQVDQSNEAITLYGGA